MKTKLLLFIMMINILLRVELSAQDCIPLSEVTRTGM
jgi:hypothetical protein